MKPVVFHAEAENELEAGVAFYESQRTGLGLAFQEEVESLLDLVRSDPQRWPLYRIPYSIFYLDLEACIWIAAVAHQKREPGYWTDRHPNP